MAGNTGKVILYALDDDTVVIGTPFSANGEMEKALEKYRINNSYGPALPLAHRWDPTKKTVTDLLTGKEESCPYVHLGGYLVVRKWKGDMVGWSTFFGTVSDITECLSEKQRRELYMWYCRKDEPHSDILTARIKFKDESRPDRVRYVDGGKILQQVETLSYPTQQGGMRELRDLVSHTAQCLSHNRMIGQPDPAGDWYEAQRVIARTIVERLNQDLSNPDAPWLISGRVRPEGTESLLRTDVPLRADVRVDVSQAVTNRVIESTLPYGKGLVVGEERLPIWLFLNGVLTWASHRPEIGDD